MSASIKATLAQGLRAVLFFLLGSTAFLVASSGPQDQAGFLWVADSQGLINVATDAGAVRFKKAQTLGFEALGINDVNGDVWAYQAPALVAYNRLGDEIARKDVSPQLLALKAVDLVVDGTAGNVWIAAGNKVHLFDMTGTYQLSKEVSGLIVAISLDRNTSTLWVAQSGQLQSYDQAGNLLQTISVSSLPNPTTAIADIAFDRSLNELWVARRDVLQRYDASGSVSFTQAGDFSGLTTPDGAGGVWNAQLMALRHVSPTGTIDVETQPYGDQPSKLIVDLVGDPTDASVWLANTSLIRHYAVDGDLAHTIDPAIEDGSIRKLARTALYSDQDAPEIQFTSPAAASLHSDTTPEVSVSYFDLGVGVDTDTLAFKVDGMAATFTCSSKTTSAATCAPASALAEGDRTITAQVSDAVGNAANPASLTIHVDSVAPVITVANPENNAFISDPSLTITGSISEPANLTINGAAVALDGANAFSKSVTLTEGENSIAFVATDPTGNVGNKSVTVTLDTGIPTTPDGGLISVTSPNNGSVTVTGAVGSVESGARVRIRNMRTGQVVTVTAGADGSFSAQINALAGDELQITALDSANNESSAHSRFVTPPDPALVAPTLSSEEFVPFVDQVSFLYSGSNPIQTGVQAGAIDASRVAVLRGLVLDVSENPLPGVMVTVNGNPQFGSTVTRADGRFDIAVNGGGSVYLNFAREGFLPVQRQFQTRAREYASSESSIVLTVLDTAVTEVTLGVGAAQFAVGSVEFDVDGTRQATILFPSGTQATMLLADGSTASLSTINVRATEYTVGSRGEEAMPANLPATSGYTYAVELSVDEALAAGAKRVNFTNPLPVYLENFLEFPVGTDVPAAYYDHDKAQWVPSKDGRVIKVLSEDVQGAVLDVVGSGQAATPTQLSDLGITSEERIAIATRYEPGNILWRVPVDHFSTLDFNWARADGDFPPVGIEQAITPPCPKKFTGCVIEPQAQSLGEDIDLVGVPSQLHYRSRRSAKGRLQSASARIPLTGSTIPADLRGIKLMVDVAGNHFVRYFEPVPDLWYTYSWDGKDPYGRPLSGTFTAGVSVDYIYDATYYRSATSWENSFSSVQPGTASLTTPADTTGLAARDIPRKSVANRHTNVYLTAAQAAPDSVAGWSFTQHHQFDAVGQILHLGSGERISASSLGFVLGSLAGLGGSTAYDIPAINYLNSQFRGAYAMSPAGELHLALVRNQKEDIAKIDKQGYIRLVKAGLNGTVRDMAFGPDGSLYILTDGLGAPEYKIHKLDTSGNLSVIAGTGPAGYSGDGGLAVNAQIGNVNELDVGSDGSVYFPDCTGAAGAKERIRRITPDGLINAIELPEGCGGYVLAVDPRGGFYYFRSDPGAPLKHLSASGQVTTVLPGGAPSLGFGDGEPVSAAKAYWLQGAVEVMADGTVLVNDSGRIRAIGPDGIIYSIAGMGTSLMNLPQPDGTPSGNLWSGGIGAAMTNGFEVDNDGQIYFGSGRIYVIRFPNPKYTENLFTLPSKDGKELYEFARTGRHVRTKDAFTGATLWQFGYDASARLISITDVDGRQTVVERDAAGTPTAIVGPDGHRSTVTVDAEGNLKSVTDPASHSIQMTYYPGGLLHTYEDQNHNTSTYTYDPDTGRLTQDVNAAGGGFGLATTVNDQTTTTTMTSALGRASIFAVEDRLDTSQRQTITAPDGTATIFDAFKNYSTLSTAPNGTKTKVEDSTDTRFGIGAPVQKVTITLPAPSTLEFVSNTTRNMTLSDPFNPLSLTNTWSETTTVNNRNYVSSYTVSSKTWTLKTPVQRQTIVTVDNQGRPATSKFASFETADYDYVNGHLELLTVGSGGSARITDFNYYPSGSQKGWLQSVTDAENRTVSYEYDAAGRVTKQTLPDSRVIEYGYDAVGNLTSLTPPGRDAHVFHYTTVNQEDEYTPPVAANVGTRVTQYQYNIDKDLDLITRPDGQTIDLVYNGGAGKKLSSIVIPTGTYAYAYKPTGQLDTLGAPGGQSLAYSYDGFLVTSEAASGTVAGTVGWVYNNNFWVTSQTVNGSAISFGYDDDGLLTTAGSLTLTRNTGHGLITATTQNTGTAVTTSHAYSTFGELSSESASIAGSAVYSAGYPVRDKLGRIKQRTETIQGVSHTFDYTYDTTGRLDTVKIDGALVSDYDYDSNGNRTALNSPTPIATYDGQDRLLTYGANSYTYTANGELLTKVDASGTTTYGYDVLGNLRTVTLPNGDAIEYVIDGRNRRVGKKVNGTLVQGFLYGNQLEPVAELDGAGTVVTRFVYGSKAHSPDYMVKAGVTYRIISDHLGSPRLAINTADGLVAQRIDYDEFGNVTNDTSPGLQPFGFAGGIYDQHTRLTRFGARDYDAETGRWTAKDPVRFEGGDTNLFGYTASDPINNFDALGLWQIALGFDIDAVVGVGAELAGGLVIDFSNPGNSGLYYSGTDATGLNVGFGVGFAVIRREIQGCGEDVDTNFGPFSPTIYKDDKGTNGIGFSWGPGYGADYSSGYTHSYTINHALNALMNSAFGRR